MKCVTKLSHRSSGGGSGNKGETEGEGEEFEGDVGGESVAAGGLPGGGSAVKRKRDDIEPLLEAQSAQLAQLQQTNADILEQLRALKELLSARAQPPPAAEKPS